MGSVIWNRRVWFVCVTLVFALGIAGCQSDEERIQAHIERAAEYGEGSDKDALLELRSALQIDPRNSEINFLIAQRRVNQEKWEDAAFFFLEAYRLDPTRSEAGLKGALLASRAGEHERALELVAQVLETDPSNPQAYRNRAEIQRATHDFEGALASVRTAFKIAPDEAVNYLALGRVYRDDFRAQMDAGSTPPDSLFQSAFEAFEKADAIQPNWIAKINLARIYVDWPGHEEDAKVKYREALRFANEQMEKDPEEHGVNLGIFDEAARVARTFKDPEFQRWAYRELLEKRPDRYDAWASLAQLEEKQSAGKGKEVLDQLLAKQPEDPKVRSVIYGFHLKQGDLEGAIAVLDQAIADGLEPASMLRFKQDLLLRTGDREGAGKVLEKLEADYPDSRELVLARAFTDISEGRPEVAALALREFVTQGESAESLLLLAEAEYARGNVPAAEAALRRSLELEEAVSIGRLSLELKINLRNQEWVRVLDIYNDLITMKAPLGLMETLGLVEALYQTNKVPSAQQILDQSFEISGEDPPAGLVILFYRWEAKRQPERAAELLETAYEKHPAHPDLLDAKIGLDLREGEIDRAIERLDRALKIQPEVARTHLLKGRLLLRAGKLEEGSREVERAFELDPHLPSALDQLLAIYRRENVPEKATRLLENELAEGRLDLHGRLRLAHLYYQQTEKEKAQVLYEEVLLASPESAQANRELALLLAEQKVDLERALALAKKAQEVSPEDPDVAHTLGFVYLQKEMYAPAVHQIEYAIELMEKRGQGRVAYHYHLSEALRGLGRHVEAGEELERAGALLPPSFIEAQKRASEESRHNLPNME